MLCSLGYAPLETHSLDLRGKFVGINQLCITEHFRFDTEKLLYFIGMQFHLYGKFLRVDKRGQRVIVSLGKELYLSRIGKLFQKVDELWHILLALLQCHTGNRDGATECTLGVLNHLQEALGGWDIAAVGYTCDNVVVGEIIIVIVVVAYIKETVTFQAKRLMNLKIEADSFHILF